LASGIANLKAKAETQIEDPGIRSKIINSLQRAEDTASNVVKKGLLKVGKKRDGDVNAENIIQGKDNVKNLLLNLPNLIRSRNR